MDTFPSTPTPANKAALLCLLSLSLPLFCPAIPWETSPYLAIQKPLLLLDTTFTTYDSARLSRTPPLHSSRLSLPRHSQASPITQQQPTHPALHLQSSVSLAFRCEPVRSCPSPLPTAASRLALFLSKHRHRPTPLPHAPGHRPSVSLAITPCSTHSLVRTHALGVTFLLRPSLGSSTGTDGGLVLFRELLTTR